MRLLWLCNTRPGVVREAIQGKPVGAVNWVDHVLSGLRDRGFSIRILCPGDGSAGALGGGCDFATFQEGKPYVYLPALERFFAGVLASFSPDVIHIWGTEYGHTLAMLRAVEAAGLLNRCAVSIQGLCSVIAGHYTQGLPPAAVAGFTLRDFLRQDNIWQQRKKFVRRGELEIQALKLARHVIGRTDWDRACVRAIHPDIRYHFCNETLREPFYQGQWRYGQCRRHRIFASSRDYPVKGFHYLLEALPQVLKSYPDAAIAVTGASYLRGGCSAALRREGYENYLRKLTRRLGLADKIDFLGELSAEEMKRAYLDANVFVLPSTSENSPNSLGEAMLLGVPCVAGCVGGVQNMMRHEEEGLIFQPTAPYMLADSICRVFAMEDQAQAMGRRAREHALKTHDPQANLDQLLAIYGSLWGKEPKWKS